VVDHRCPRCDKEFVSVWEVPVGEEGGYRPLFGDPVVLHYGWCDGCQTDYEHTGDESWRRRGSG